MKKSKRILALLLAMSAAGTTMGLTGCEKKENGEKYNIDWYIVTGTVPNEGAKAEVEDEVNKYLEENNLAATLTMNYLDWGAYDQKVNVMIAGGDKFDICYTSADTYRLNASKNAYLPINDLMDEYAPKTKALLGEDFLAGSQIDGVNYGIPANKDKGHYQGMIYRTDIAEKYGLTEQLQSAKTFDDIMPILDIIKEKEPSMTPLFEGGVFSVASLIPFETIAFPAGIVLTGDGTEVVNFVELPEYKEATIRTAQNLKDGYTRKGEKKESENHFIEFIGLKPGKDKEEAASRNYDYTQIDTLGFPYMTSQDAMGSIMAISRTSKNPELVMQFLEMFNTDKYLHNLIVYGIEGKHYTKLDENRIEPIKDSGYGNAGMQWEFGNTFLDYLTKDEAEDKVEKMEEFNKNLKPAPTLGFAFDSEPVKVELGACQNVKAEFEGTLANGVENPEEVLNNYITKLKSAGADRVVEEVQKQYDAWREARAE